MKKIIEKTKAYKNLQSQVQTSFDFAVAVTHGIPALDLQLDLVKKSKIQKPPIGDFFQYTIYYILRSTDFPELKLQNIPNEIITDFESIENFRFKKYDEFLSTVQGKINKFQDLYEKAILTNYRNTIINVGTKGIEHLKKCYSDYKYKLAIYLYISTFSFFESFIQDIIQEVIEKNHEYNLYEFHKKYFADCNNIKYQDLKEKLLGNTDNRHIDRYKKVSKELLELGYVLPYKLLNGIGVKLLEDKLKSISANDIPQLLKLFHLELDKTTIDEFHQYRDNRNKLAHGENSFKPTLKEVTEVNEFLKKLASKIDFHVMEHFIPFANWIDIQNRDKQ